MNVLGLAIMDPFRCIDCNRVRHHDDKDWHYETGLSVHECEVMVVCERCSERYKRETNRKGK